MKKGRTDIETLRLNGWGVGTVLKSQIGSKIDLINITAIGKIRILCLWDHGCTGFWEEETTLTTLSDRDWEFVEDTPVEMPITVALKTEEQTMIETIKAARKIQEFLWKEMNDDCGLEEIKRMFRKRIAKIDEISMDNPHWKVEFKKRLLQVAGIAVNFITKADNDQIKHDGIHPTLKSNLAEYANDQFKAKMQDSVTIKKKILIGQENVDYNAAAISAYNKAKYLFEQEGQTFDSIHVEFHSMELIGMKDIRRVKYVFKAWVESDPAKTEVDDDFWI